MTQQERLCTKHMHELNYIAHDIALGVPPDDVRKRLKALAKSKIADVKEKASTMLSALPDGVRARKR